MSQQAGSRSQSAASRRQARREAAIRRDRQKRLMQMVGGAVLAAVVVAGLLIFLNRPSNTASTADYSGIAFSPPSAVSAAGAGATAVASHAGQATVRGAVLGDPNAPVTMVVYTDFQCPYCGQFAREVQPQIVNDFVRPGKVKLEFREFPFLGGTDLTAKDNESSQSAQAVLCAAEQGSYLAYHDKLYANQQGENQGAFRNDRLKKFAKDLGLNTEQFNQCLDSGKYEPAVTAMKAEGEAQGVTGTPTFFINGQLTQMSSQGYDLLKKQLETAYEQAK